MVILDFISPLIPHVVDARGNAQHWFIRTAEAANETTMLGWQGKFSTPEEWDSLCATPASNAFTPSVNPRYVSRRGLSAPMLQAKHLGRFRGAYAKALANWEFAFREEGDQFFEVLTRSAPFYEEATRDFLGYMGLHIRNWLGSIAVHIMLLCGNRRAWDFMVNNVDILHLHFPDHPIIAVTLRPFFNQECMAALGRDFFRMLPQPNAEELNQLLDVIVTAYISSDYAVPPFSFIHLENTSGFWQMHSRVVSTFAVKPPVARSWHAPLKQPVPLPGVQVLLADLFFYAVAGDLPIASLTLTLSTEETNYPIPKIYVVPSDHSLLPQPLDGHIPTQITLPALTAGVTWQVILQINPIPGASLVGFAEGSFVVTDTVGTDSEPASWLIRGSVPTMEPIAAGGSNAVIGSYPAVIISDVFAFTHEADVPLVSLSMVISSITLDLYGFSLLLHRSDSGVSDINLSGSLNVVHTVPVPPGGVFWQLAIDGVGGMDIVYPTIWHGHAWCTDIGGVESNHASVDMSISP